MASFTALFAFALRNFTYHYDLTLPFLVGDLSWHSNNDHEVGLIEFKSEEKNPKKGKGKMRETTDDISDIEDIGFSIN